VSKVDVDARPLACDLARMISAESDFLTLTTPRSIGALRFSATIPEGWEQGRGAFGGLVVAALIRAMEASEPTPDRSLRSLTAEICGPVLAGEIEIAVRVLRRGSGVTTLAAQIEQDGEVAAHAVGVLGRARADRPRRSFLAPPSPPPWREVAPLPDPPPAFVPRFARFLEMRNVGPAPFSGAAEPEASGWVRMKNPGAARDAAFLAALADAYWPAIFSVEAATRPVGTIAFTFQPLGTCDGLDPEAPFFNRARVVAEAEGYTVELRELWGEDGRLLALNEQTIAIIR
jgi:hypothetical protein